MWVDINTLTLCIRKQHVNSPEQVNEALAMYKKNLPKKIKPADTDQYIYYIMNNATPPTEYMYDVSKSTLLHTAKDIASQQNK